jgi:hypothetical protein
MDSHSQAASLIDRHVAMHDEALVRVDPIAVDDRAVGVRRPFGAIGVLAAWRLLPGNFVGVGPYGRGFGAKGIPAGSAEKNTENTKEKRGSEEV